MTRPVRVRFAPSPTGFLHLGSVRSALLNYMFAQKYQGTFILRIEDTDASREVTNARERIISDLAWLGLDYHEGPIKNGPYAPYLQSERNEIYQKHLKTLIEKNLVYRCFCTPEELEAKRQKQIAMSKPPRYDRTCTKLAADAIEQKVAAKIPFVWRFKLDYEKTVTIKDLARGTVSFELKNFSDFALTRHDGSCTFMFVNFIDDWLMEISHAIRGEDHLTNTALQAALYEAFNVEMPIFWHQQIICNKNGEKLSKRDFGFSLDDLRNEGYLPHAINNYMATVGVSLKEEFLPLAELINVYNFEKPHHTGTIRYDEEKLLWFNHKWIGSLPAQELAHYALPFINQSVPGISTISDEKRDLLLASVKGETKTLKDFTALIEFYFKAPKVNRGDVAKMIGPVFEAAVDAVSSALEQSNDGTSCVDALKAEAQKHGLKIKDVFVPLRMACVGRVQGINILDMVNVLGIDETKNRWQALCK